MKLTRISFILMIALAFSMTANAQTKSITGKVIDYNCTMRGWCYITIQSGSKQYEILIESGAYAPTEQRADGSFPTPPKNPKTVGNVTKVGRFVQVFYYTRQTQYGDLEATRIVEIKRSKSKKK
ncbi:MAG TPA: hypothetical protein VIT88_14620 [Pyrinomonadaceae bacterium]